MSAKEKEAPSSSSSSLELDPLLKDLMLSFRKHVVSLLAELKDVRNRLASQEESFIKESQSRKVAEMKATSMEEEVGKLQICLEERNKRLMATSSSSEQLNCLNMVVGLQQGFSSSHLSENFMAGERRNKVLKELRDQVAVEQQDKAGSDGKQNIWESSGFKVIVTMSMFLVALSRQ